MKPTDTAYLEQNLVGCFERVFKESAALAALTDYMTQETFSYAQVGYEIMRLHKHFSTLGLEKGDRIVLYGTDSARWSTAFMATITYGAVVVPLLPDFNPADACRLVEHSGARLLFVDEKHPLGSLKELSPALVGIYDIDTLSPTELVTGELSRAIDTLHKAWPHKPATLPPYELAFAQTDNRDLILINYTSGTTGNSKGVMLTGQNIAGNAIYAHRLDLMYRGDNILCFLPLAHAYSCAFNLFTPMTLGAHVVILGRIPSPNVLFRAFSEVRPNLIIAVPLVIEKIYKLAIAPKIALRAMRIAMKTPLIGSIIRGNIRRRLVKIFGGRFREVIVGGAALSPEVGQFFHKIGFPLMVGYGMTECGPLISYAPWHKWVPTSCGKILNNMELKIDRSETAADSPEGEICVKGMNVCLGYYRNEEANAALFTADGWMRTGDLGHVDSRGNLYIRGRSKTMLLSANGQNIYPEDIEQRIGLEPLILENLVVMRGNQLVALIVLDDEAVKRAGLSSEEAWSKVEALRVPLNKQLAGYEQLARFERVETPFEKTPKRSIKRFLYE